MSSLEKLIQKVLAGKKISYKDAERILLGLGFNVKIAGSHHVFRKIGTPYNISLKKRPELLAYQIKMLQEVLLNHGYEEK